LLSRDGGTRSGGEEFSPNAIHPNPTVILSRDLGNHITWFTTSKEEKVKVAEELGGWRWVLALFFMFLGFIFWGPVNLGGKLTSGIFIRVSLCVVITLAIVAKVDRWLRQFLCKFWEKLGDEMSDL
jgi:hypothetical protein